MKLTLHIAGVGLALLLQSKFYAQTMAFSPIGVESSITATSKDVPVSSSVGPFKNGAPAGYTTISIGLFSFPIIATSLNDELLVGPRHVWNSDVNGNPERWTDGLNKPLVTGGTWEYSSKYKGVVTQWSLDPAHQHAYTMMIDRSESMPLPALMSVNQVASNSINVRFNRIDCLRPTHTSSLHEI